jgi:dimethylglycine dehydrogenase
MVHGDSEINRAGLDPRRFGRYAPGDYTRAKAFEDYEHMYALHLPGEERPAARKTRVTPLYDRLAAQGCVYTEANGWERPKWFSLDGRAEQPGFRHNNVFEVVAEECRAVRERVGILDLSSFAKYEVTGTGAEAYLNRICANRMPRREGGIALAHFLSVDGRIIGEATITRLGEERFYVLSGAGAEDGDMDHLSQPIAAGEEVRVVNITDDWGVLVLAGPRARDLLAKLTGAELSNGAFRWLTGKEIEVAGVALRALRVNYVGELGWELHCPMARLVTLYDAIWAAGQEFGIANFGVYAVNSLRMEKAYKGWGAELTNEITMVEADMERFVGYDKEDFVGKAATLKVKQAGVETQLVYVEVAPGDCDVHGGEPVIARGRVVGVTTSGGYGHHTGKSLGFAYVEPELAAPGSAFEIDLLGVPHAAKVLAEPAYDPKNERLRA